MNDSDEVLSSLEFAVDPSKIPTVRTIPLGDFVGEIKGFKGTKSKATDQLDDEARAKGKVGGKVAIEMQLQVDQPETHRGILHIHRFWLGSDDDPEAKKPQTWMRNGSDLMAMLKHSGVTVTESSRIKEAMMAAVGQKVGVHSYVKTSKRLDPRTGKPYPSRVEVGSWWKPGTREVNTREEFAIPEESNFNTASDDFKLTA